jgi:uncharacterized protein YajQ (UPF0234 family)
MPSFDVVSELDKHEVTNAVDNAVKELDRRYDLKGKGSFEFKDKDQTVLLTAEAEFQLEAMIEILRWPWSSARSTCNAWKSRTPIRPAS